MPLYLRQSTASQEVPLGYFVDSTDGNTEETGLTIANTDIKIWKTGATTLANKNSGGGTHISNGIYYAVLDATDTDTIGSLVLFIHVSGALSVRVECVVLDEAIYDQMFGTTAFATTSAVASAVWDLSTSGHTTAGTFGEQCATDIDAILVDTGTTLDGRIPAALVSGRIDASVGAMAANVLTATAINADAITAAKVAADVTTELQSGLATAASIAALNNISAAQVNAEVVDALATDTYAEPGQGAPAATTTLAAKINYMYKNWRNRKTQTSTTWSLYADDATTVDQKATVADDGTTGSKTEITTGP